MSEANTEMEDIELNRYLTDIADSIRAVDGTTEKINAQNFSTRIRTLNSSESTNDMPIIALTQTTPGTTAKLGVKILRGKVLEGDELQLVRKTKRHDKHCFRKVITKKLDAQAIASNWLTLDIQNHRQVTGTDTNSISHAYRPNIKYIRIVRYPPVSKSPNNTKPNSEPDQRSNGLSSNIIPVQITYDRVKGIIKIL